MTAKQLKNIMSHRRIPKANLADIELLIQCHAEGNYEPMKETKLYTQHSAEYCEYLEILC